MIKPKQGQVNCLMAIFLVMGIMSVMLITVVYLVNVHQSNLFAMWNRTQSVCVPVGTGDGTNGGTGEGSR